MGGYNPGYSMPAQGTSATSMSGYGAGSTGDPSTSNMYGSGMGGGAMQQQQQPPMGMPLAHQPAPVGMSPQGGADMSSMMSQFSVQHQQLVHRQQGMASGQQPMGVGQHGLGVGQQRMVPSQLNQLQAQVCKSGGQAVAESVNLTAERLLRAYVRVCVSRLLSAPHKTAALDHPTIISIDSTVGLLKISSVRGLPSNFAMSLNSFTPASLHSLHPFTPASLHPCIPSLPASLHPCIPSPLHPFTPASLHPCIPSPLHPFTPASLHPCIPSPLHPFTPASLHT